MNQSPRTTRAAARAALARIQVGDGSVYHLQVAVDDVEAKEMNRMIQHRLVAMLAAVALAVFTGTALAGNGNGNGSNGHGNSANAPGHQQQASQPAAPAAQAAPATQPAPADNHATPPG